MTFKIRNTSKVAGREAAQVYISDLQSSLPRPVKELKIAFVGEGSKNARKEIMQ
jgi:beta-glucosidase